MSDRDIIVDLPSAIFAGQRGGNGNELTFDQTKSAPPDAIKYRGGAWREGHLIDFSGDLLTGDSNDPKRAEKVLLVLRTDDHPSVLGQGCGCFEFYTQDPNTVDDAGMKLRLRLGARGAEFFVPITAPGLGGSGTGDGSSLTSPNGQYRAQMQDDGNFVVYALSPLKALWSWLTGRL